MDLEFMSDRIGRVIKLREETSSNMGGHIRKRGRKETGGDDRHRVTEAAPSDARDVDIALAKTRITGGEHETSSRIVV